MMAKKKTAKELTWASSGGGPFLVLPVVARTKWLGTKNDDYNRACRLGERGGLLDVGGVKAFVLGTPDSVAWYPREDGGLLVRQVCADDESQIPVVLADLPEDALTPTKIIFDVPAGGLLAFDSAAGGADKHRGGCLEIDLPAGRYAIDGALSLDGKGWKPDDTMELDIFRLRRIT
jgi:hypothetical protein